MKLGQCWLMWKASEAPAVSFCLLQCRPAISAWRLCSWAELSVKTQGSPAESSLLMSV
jgi:hypothetical protein